MERILAAPAIGQYRTLKTTQSLQLRQNRESASLYLVPAVIVAGYIKPAAGYSAAAGVRGLYTEWVRIWFGGTIGVPV